jgi:hypothetical protein
VKNLSHRGALCGDILAFVARNVWEAANFAYGNGAGREVKSSPDFLWLRLTTSFRALSFIPEGEYSKEAD